MSSPVKSTAAPVERPNSSLNSRGPGDDDRLNRLVHQAAQGHHAANHLPMPGLSGTPNTSVGNLLRGPVDADGNLKDAALTVGIKLDLEAEVHLTARVRGDILVGLY